MLAADVVVVGAGPAGVAAAVHLTRAGREVLLVDKATFPRDKCCGDGLTTAALRSLEDLGLDPAAVGSWTTLDEVLLRSPSGREVVLPLPHGQGQFAVVARRIDLDAALVEVARAAGVQVVEGAACTGAHIGADQVTLTIDGLGEVAARYAIGADGAWSPLRKILDLDQPGYLGDWHAFRQYFTGVSEQAARQLVVWFEPDLLPGYAWSFPLAGGRANVGFGIQRDGTPTPAMKAQWTELLKRPHIAELLGPDAEPESPHKAWPIPARVGQRLLHAGRVLFVGDAAAATDPMTGEGIAQALQTGELAARAIAAAGPHHALAAGAGYEAAVHRELGVDAALSRLLVPILRTPLGARGAVRGAGLTAWTRRNFARWMFEDYPRAYAATPSRWLRHSMVGPGAFGPARTGTPNVAGHG